MRKVEAQMVKAFNSNSNWKGKNTEVKSYDGQTCVYLHGHLIAHKNCLGAIRVTNAGWFTPTTKSRLNALGANVSQRNFQWYIGNEPWDGNIKQIA